MITKPMLAAHCTNINKIKFPVLATPKIDGIRCLRINGRSVSRTFKDIPNRYIQEKMKDLPDGLDGELVVLCDLGMMDNFQKTTSGVMSQNEEPNFEYWIFDRIGQRDIAERYEERMAWLGRIRLPGFCKKLIPIELFSVNNLRQYEKMCLEIGHEGIMIRQPDSPYKCGRSTEKEGYLIKIKRFKDSEAVVIGFEEQMENTNKATIDKLGHIKRSTHQEGLIGKNTLGKFVVREVGNTKWKGEVFCIGTGIGLTKKRRQQIWNFQELYLEKIITYKYQEIGTKNLPRCPIFKDFRED